jgi:uncharacterized protein YodC (DUF2158 family)
MEFNSGDVVKLKSGGPSMTVNFVTESTHSNNVHCYWHDFQNSKTMIDTFPSTVLEKVDVES